MQISLEQLAREAQLAERLAQRAHTTLTHAIQAGLRAGYSQREIARAVGRSQPEISRLARFHGQSSLGRTLRAHRAEVLAIARRHGLSNVRVFGSVARDEETADSDIDLLVAAPAALSLFTLAVAEEECTAILGVTVEITPDRNLRPYLADRIHREAIPL